VKGSGHQKLETVSYLAHAIPNDGAFWWYVGKDTALGDDYMIQLTLQTLPTDPPRGEFLSPRFSVANSTESAIPAAARDSPKNNSNAWIPYPDLSTISASILTGIVIGIAISCGVYVYFYSGASRTRRSGKLTRSEFKPQSQTSAVEVGNESTSGQHTKKFNHEAIYGLEGE